MNSNTRKLVYSLLGALNVAMGAAVSQNLLQGHWASVLAVVSVAVAAFMKAAAEPDPAPAPVVDKPAAIGFQAPEQPK